MRAKRAKTKHLKDHVPNGYVTTKHALKQAGYSLHQIDNFVKSAQLEIAVPGVYKQPDTQIHWEGVIASLQKMSADVTVSGRTALELSGFGHYLELGDKQTIYLSTADALPPWVKKILPSVILKVKTRSSLLDLSLIHI